MSADQKHGQLRNRRLADYRRILYRIARADASSAADESELAQEMIVQLWRSLPSYRQQCKPSTWSWRVFARDAHAASASLAPREPGNHPAGGRGFMDVDSAP
jgi:DNA-directed RNA polymerase specialized sigma24 family protein